MRARSKPASERPPERVEALSRPLSERPIDASDDRPSPRSTPTPLGGPPGDAPRPPPPPPRPLPCALTLVVNAKASAIVIMSAESKLFFIWSFLLVLFEVRVRRRERTQLRDIDPKKRLPDRLSCDPHEILRLCLRERCNGRRDKFVIEIIQLPCGSAASIGEYHDARSSTAYDRAQQGRRRASLSVL